MALSLFIAMATPAAAVFPRTYPEAHAQQTKCGKGEPEKESGQAGDKIIQYTFWLTGFTGALVLVGIGQAGFLGLQIMLARNEFDATHRPKLIVRRVSADCLKVGELPQAQFIIANVGGSAATLLEGNAALVFQRGSMLPAIPPDDGDHNRMPETIYRPGPGAPTKAYRQTILSGEELAIVKDPASLGFCIAGYIKYRGRKNGPIYYTAFGRRYDPASERFAVLDDPNYEYSD